MTDNPTRSMAEQPTIADRVTDLLGTFSRYTHSAHFDSSGRYVDCDGMSLHPVGEYVRYDDVATDLGAIVQDLLVTDQQRARNISRLTMERDDALEKLSKRADGDLHDVAARLKRIEEIARSSDSYVPQDVAAQCLLTLEPLNERGKPNTLIALVERAMADLGRLAGPVCPHDGKRAIEHCRWCGNAVDRTMCWCGDSMHDGNEWAGHSGVPRGCDCSRDPVPPRSHPEWAGEAWLRDRSRN